MDGKIRKIEQYIRDPDYRFLVNRSHGIYKNMPDDVFLKRIFKIKMGRELDLDNPKTFNEKLQWLKIHDRKPIYTTMVDKYAVKDYVAAIIGEQYIIPTFGVWDGFNEIDFAALPNQFVLKCTHDSHGVVICRDKTKLDLDMTRKKITHSLNRNYFDLFREWPYKNVPPRIIAEKYMEEAQNGGECFEPVLKDYKLQCFNGKFDNIFVAEGRFSKRGIRYHFFDKDWNYLPYCPYDDICIDELSNLKPKHFEEMICIAEKLAKNLPELRVDLYEINGRVYFGELTFYSQSGFDTDLTEEADRILGSKLTLQ